MGDGYTTGAGAAAAERTVFVNGMRRSEADARSLERCITINEKANDEYRHLAARIRAELKRTEVVTLSTTFDSAMRVTGKLSNGATAIVQPRSTGAYGGAGFYVSSAPAGHEWALVQDAQGLTVLVLRKQAEPASGSEPTCAKNAGMLAAAWSR